MAKKINQKPISKAAPVQQKEKKTPSPVVKKNEQSKFVLSLTAKLSILLAIVAFIVYYNTLSNGYVLDDVMVVKDNSMVRKGMSAIPDILSTPHLIGYLKLGNDTYRPLSLVFFAAIFQFAGDNTAVYHFFNILVFAGCVIVFFLFLYKMFERKKMAMAFIAALLFAVHPIHTECVANIKSLDELLCFFFAFLSLNFYSDYMKEGKNLHLILGAVTLYLAYISKETVIAFLVVVPVVFYLYHNNNNKRSLLITITATLAGILFLAIRWMILTKYKANVHSNINFVDNFLVRSPTPISRLATEILILGKYFLLHVKPYPLISDYSYRAIPYVYFSDIWVLVSLALYLGLIGTAVYRLLKFKKDPLAFGIFFYLATFALFSNIPFYIGSALAERFAFYASAGFCIMVAFAVEKWLAKSEDITILKDKRVLFSVVPIAVIFGFLTMDRNSDWKDDYTLYKTDIERSPNNTRLGYDLANEMEKIYEKETDPVKKQQMIKESMGHLRKSLEIYPYNTDSHVELGVDYFNQQMFDSAITHFKRAIELNPRQSNAMYNLGTIYLRLNRFAEAQVYYHKTIEVNTDRFPAIFNEGVCYYQLMKYDSAIYDFKRTIQLAPDYYNYKSFGYTAIVYKTLGNMDSSRKYEVLAKKYEPGFRMP